MPPIDTRPKPTIYEIAERAGVSSSTVARVLRGDVKETWKSTARRAEQIRRIAEEMGYRPNWRARALSTQRSWTMGLLYTRRIEIFDGVHGQIVTGFNDQLRGEGYQLLLLPVESKQFEDVVLGSRLDGCAMLARHLPEKPADFLRRSGMPSVLLNGRSKLLEHRVEVDDYEGGFAAAQHLLELGHRRINLFVNESAEVHYSIDDRRRGVDAALRQAGIPADDFYHRVPLEEMARRLVDPTRRPTGLICYSHAEAVPILSALYEHQVRVPDAISVVAFNDVYPAAVSAPPLTTVSFDPEQLGRTGAKMLLRRFEGDEISQGESTVYTLKHRLTVRASTGPPSA